MKKSRAKKTAAKKRGAKKSGAKNRRGKSRSGRKTTASRAAPRKTRAKRAAARRSMAPAGGGVAAAALIDARIRELPAWQAQMLARLRALVKEADPQVVEEWKWSIPVWSHDGLICTGETYQSVVKMTFARGASLEDPARLFNSSLEGSVRRAIDFREGATIDEESLKALLRAAVALNQAKAAG
jgi:hypothetical protein